MGEASRRYLSLQEGSNVLGVAPSTLAKWATEGKVPGYRLPGGHWRFVAEDLLLALAPGRQRRERHGGAR